MNCNPLRPGSCCRYIFSLSFFLLFQQLSAQTPNSSSYWIANSNTTGAKQTALSLGNWSSPTTVPSFQLNTTDGGSGTLEIHSTREGSIVQFTRADASLPNVNILTIYGGQGGGSNVTLYNSSNTATGFLNGQGASYFTGGNVLIGKTTQTNSSYLLDVNGSARANQVVVNTTGADFVFDPKYRLPPLKTVEKYIQATHHLPDIAPAAQMQDQGINLGENQTRLLQKIEELTLYVIEQNKQLENLNRQNRRLGKQNLVLQTLEKRIRRLENSGKSVTRSK